MKTHQRFILYNTICKYSFLPYVLSWIFLIYSTVLQIFSILMFFLSCLNWDLSAQNLLLLQPHMGREFLTFQLFYLLP